MQSRTKSPLLVLLGLFILSSTAAAQRREPDWEVLRTNHYEIRYSCTPVEAKYLGDWMEFVHGAYSYIVKVQSKDRHVIKLFKDRKEWLECGQPPGAGAYYTLTTKQLVGYYDRKAVFPYFAHEGTHQFMHIAVPEMSKLIPTWFSEGLADCMGSSTVIKGQFRWCQFHALIAEGRTYVIKKALRENKARPLADLFRLDHRDFMKDASLNYAESWSFVHFLFCCPEVEIPHKVIPNGDYKDALVTYLDHLRRGDDHDKSWEEALKTIGKTHEEIEKAWKDYVLNVLPETGPQDDDAYMGVRTQEDKRGGIAVLMVLEDGPAYEGGLRKGDILLSLNGKRLMNSDVFTEELKKRKPGDEIRVVVLRDKKRMTLKITLGRRGDYNKDKDEPKKEEPKEKG